MPFNLNQISDFLGRPLRLHLSLHRSILLFLLLPATHVFGADENSRLGWACVDDESGGWKCREVDITGTRAGSPPSSTKTIGLNQRLDWLPLEKLTEEQKQETDVGCCGAFVSPEPTDPSPPAEAELTWSSGPVSGTAEVLHLTDGVDIQNGNLSLQAEAIDLNQLTGDAEMSKDIVIRQPGLLFRGSKAKVNRDSLTARIEDAEFVLHEQQVHGSASVLDRSETGLLTLEDSEFSTCEPEDRQWYLRGQKITIDPEKHRGVARNISLNAFGVPVFYSPYLVFPVGDERLSGFLFPTFSSEDISIPYYINLAPNYDLTLAPHFVRERGAMLESEFRHLSPWFMHQLSVGWLGNGKDDISDNEQSAINSSLNTPLGNPFTAEEATKYEGENRWALNLQQDGGKLSNLDSDWFSTVDYTKVSDSDYFRHLETTNVEISKASHLIQSGEFGYDLQGWRLSARIESYQTILEGTTEPYRQKPSLMANGQYRWGELELSLDHEFTQYEHREEFYNPSNPIDRRIEGDRLRTDYKLSWNQEWLWGFVKPSALLKSLSYRLDSETIAIGRDDSPSMVVPQATLDMGLFFERDGSWFGDNYLQTFEPHLFYFYSKLEEHDELYSLSSGGRNLDFGTGELTFNYNQLFRDTRFSGGDRIEDANQVSVGLTTRFLGNESGVERLRISLGQIFYQEDRQVTLNGSPLTKKRSKIAGQFAAQLTDSWRFSSDVLYDHEDNVLADGNVSVRYLDDNYRILNLSYRYTRNRPFDSQLGRTVDRDDSQGDLSFLWPLSERWNVIGRSYYDFTNERELDSIFGLEYNSCCYRIRLVGRHWLDEDLIDIVGSLDEDAIEVKKGIFFEFQFKGLGGLGNRLSNMLNDSVVNHEKREQRL